MMFVTQVHRTTFHRAAAYRSPDKNQEPAQMLACKHTEKPEEELATVNTPSQRRTGLEGPQLWCQRWLLRDGRGTEGRGILLLPPDQTSSFFILVVFSKEFCPTKKFFSLDTDKEDPEWAPEMALLPPARDQQEHLCSFSCRLVMKWGDAFCSLRGRGSGTTAVLLPCTHSTGQLLNDTMLPH